MTAYPTVYQILYKGLDPVSLLQAIGRDIHELFHLRLLKWVLGVHREASNVGIYGELGRLPLIFDGIKLSCDYFERCIALSDDTLAKKLL